MATEMTAALGRRFKRAGKIYYLAPGDDEYALDEQLVVETARGLEIGWVALPPDAIVEAELEEPLKPILRRATPEDVESQNRYKSMQHEVVRKAKRRIAEMGLPMKLIGAEYAFDGTRLTLYFTAEGRVDFRELVRELAGMFRTRIDLRQIGARDESRHLGGLGRCGRGLCCSTFLVDYPNVSMKMAKDQDLSLNPQKITGVCGKLLCCLSYEHVCYCELKKDLPRHGDEVVVPQGEGRVIAVNALKQSVVVALRNGPAVEVAGSEARVVSGAGGGRRR